MAHITNAPGFVVGAVTEAVERQVKTTPQQNAIQAQLPEESETEIPSEVIDQLVAAVGLEPTNYGL